MASRSRVSHLELQDRKYQREVVELPLEIKADIQSSSSPNDIFREMQMNS